MNDRMKFAINLGIVALTVGGYGVYTAHTLYSERKKREMIRINSELQIAAIKTARDKVMERMEAGLIDATSYEALINDFNFELIAARYDK